MTENKKRRIKSFECKLASKLYLCRRSTSYQHSTEFSRYCAQSTSTVLGRCSFNSAKSRGEYYKDLCKCKVQTKCTSLVKYIHRQKSILLFCEVVSSLPLVDVRCRGLTVLLFIHEVSPRSCVGNSIVYLLVLVYGSLVYMKKAQ